MVSRFTAVACQTIVRPITEDVMTHQEGRAIIKENMDAAVNLMRKGANDYMGVVKLVTFPEMFLTLAPVWAKRPTSDWYDLGCVEVPGPELEPLFQAARDLQIFIGANVYERDPRWPNRYFNCSFLIDPSGEVILKYRRLHSTLTPSPHDFLDEYVDALGWDSLFPVAKTEIGNIAMFPCREITFPEVARMFALKGAEIFIHSTNDSADFPGWTACKQARALENNCYLISTNAGGWVSKRGFLETTNAGGTIMVDYMGSIFKEVRTVGESHNGRGTIDVGQLRAYRHSSSPMNVIAQLRTELYTEYKKTITPPNQFTGAMVDRRELRTLYKGVMDRMTEEGIFPKP
ncbi:MAG: nitrilase-related carbon-nitrogen hydrolase [Gammaproteobacteria bacterium]